LGKFRQLSSRKKLPVIDTYTCVHVPHCTDILFQVAVMAKPSKARRQLSGVPPLAKATITTPVSNGVGDHNTRQITSIDKNAGTLEDTQCASAGVAGERGGGGNGGQAIWRGGPMEVCMANVEGCHDQQAEWRAMFEEEDLSVLDNGGVTERFARLVAVFKNGTVLPCRELGLRSRG
jgi:hypothetical protein